MPSPFGSPGIPAQAGVSVSARSRSLLVESIHASEVRSSDTNTHQTGGHEDVRDDSSYFWLRTYGFISGLAGIAVVLLGLWATYSSYQSDSEDIRALVLLIGLASTAFATLLPMAISEGIALLLSISERLDELVESESLHDDTGRP